MGKMHPVRGYIEIMEPGEKLQIPRSDFTWKRHTPNYFCNQIAEKKGRKFRVWKMRDKSGWIVERLV